MSSFGDSLAYRCTCGPEQPHRVKPVSVATLEHMMRRSECFIGTLINGVLTLLVNKARGATL